MLKKWSNVLSKSYCANTVRFLKYVWPFFNIIYERVNHFSLDCRKVFYCKKSWALSFFFFFLLSKVVCSIFGLLKSGFKKSLANVFLCIFESGIKMSGL